jgi:hypothetical protein
MGIRADLPKESRCYDCMYRMSRLIIPLDPEEFNLEPGDIMVDHMCCLTEEDISNIIVKDCTRYSKGNLDSLFVRQKIF